MVNVILASVLAVLAGAIVVYLVRVKKRGQTCIGCPHANKCPGNCQSGQNTEK